LALLTLAIYGTWLTLRSVRRHTGGFRLVMIVGLVAAGVAVLFMFPPLMSLGSVNSCLY